MSDKHSYWIHSVKLSGGLNSVDRINEIIFGLIMVLTFTCSISAATAAREEVSTILWSALGCNIAWGFVDAFMYLFSALLERGEMFSSVRNIRRAHNEISGNEAVKQALTPFMVQVLEEQHISYLRNKIQSLPDPPLRVFLTWRDLRDCVVIFLLVFFATFPVTIPFIFIHHIPLAMRVSNAIALILLFFTGVYLAKKTGSKKILTGLGFTMIGVVLVAVTIALGG